LVLGVNFSVNTHFHIQRIYVKKLLTKSLNLHQVKLQRCSSVTKTFAC